MSQDPLFPVQPLPPHTIVINPQCRVTAQHGTWVVFVSGIPVYQYEEGDTEGLDVVIALLLVNGRATQHELVAAFGRSRSSVHRARVKFEQAGVRGLVHKKRGPKGPRMTAAQDAAIRAWHAEGSSRGEMARRLGKAPSTVGAAMKRLGLPSRPPSRAPQLPLMSPAKDGETAPVASEDDPREPRAADMAPVGTTGTDAHPAAEMGTGAVDGAGAGPGPAPRTAPLPSKADEEGPHRRPAGTLDTCPTDRSIDRTMARAGVLLDAVPWFAASPETPNAGVLLALPFLVASGIFDEARRVYGDIGPAFYGLRTTLLTFLLLALLRIKRPENIKEHPPPMLGRLLGLDRMPEVKTLRRKLAILTADGSSEHFLTNLFRRRIQAREEALGFLYVDGHVRVYHGKADLPKTHAARLRLSLPATQDTWVHDEHGDPVFVVTEQAHPQLVSTLPAVLDRVRVHAGAQRRLTVVFDRGGWSPKLFKKLYNENTDVLTYRKGTTEPVPAEWFEVHDVPTDHGIEQFELHDMSVFLAPAKMWMRQVTRKKGEHQTTILTTRQDLSTVEVARRMFARWRQENFFKYMRAEYALDALVEHGTEPDDPSRMVPNPERKELTRRINEARRDVAELEARYGAAAIDNPERKRPSMRGFKIAHGTEIGIPLRQARDRLEALEQERRQTPTRVPIGTIRDQVVKLKPLRKRLTDALKMVAYQAETDMTRLIAPHYRRSLDEGRRLVVSAMHSAADIEPTQDELRITLAPQSSPHRTRVVHELCKQLNETATCFPGTNLRLTYAVHGAECVT